MALCSTAPVTGISHIRVYHDDERQSITGLMLCYRSRPPSVLGELREFLAEYSPPSIDTIQGFAFSYSPGFNYTIIHHLELLMGQNSITFGTPIPGVLEQRFTRNVRLIINRKYFVIVLMQSNPGRNVPEMDFLALHSPYRVLTSWMIKDTTYTWNRREVFLCQIHAVLD
jgi:hypothetical protein